ncbi:uncharacterized protein LOC112589383 [Harpegnathos saltator]|uniref:uncharacterized protein LOC112589383 n=1 Tax=Harpegnathos saltator TaxID=610380 RepID=UPI000DBEE712|nr:uncharacterized protein LOC112589383 [Harpegnathos saltator]
MVRVICIPMNGECGWSIPGKIDSGSTTQCLFMFLLKEKVMFEPPTAKENMKQEVHATLALRRLPEMLGIICVNSDKQMFTSSWRIFSIFNKLDKCRNTECCDFDFVRLFASCSWSNPTSSIGVDDRLEIQVSREFSTKECHLALLCAGLLCIGLATK